MPERDMSHIDPIKNSFARVKRKAPESLWSALDHRLSLDGTEQAVAGAFSTVTRKAPESGWQGIKKQLIIDEVWLNISAALDKRKRRLFWWYLSGFSVLFVAGMTAWKFFPEGRFITGHVAGPGPEQAASLVWVDPSLKENISFMKTAVRLKADRYNTTQLAVPVHTNQTDPLILVSSGFSDSACESLAEKQITALNLFGTAVSDEPLKGDLIVKFSLRDICPIERTDKPVALPGPVEKRKSFFYRFELGVAAGVDNTWIFNNDVKDGLNRFSLVDNKFSFGYHSGINAGINFSERHGLGLQVNFLSAMSQRYDFFTEGSIQTYHVSLRQQKYNLVYRFTLPGVLSYTQAFVFKGGGFMAFTGQSELYTDKNLVKEKVFERFDAGLTAAIGSQHSLGSWVFEYGLQSDIGFANIATGWSESPKEFNYTSTYLTGVYCSLSYRF